MATEELPGHPARRAPVRRAPGSGDRTPDRQPGVERRPRPAWRHPRHPARAPPPARPLHRRLPRRASGST